MRTVPLVRVAKGPAARADVPFGSLIGSPAALGDASRAAGARETHSAGSAGALSDVRDSVRRAPRSTVVNSRAFPTGRVPRCSGPNCRRTSRSPGDRPRRACAARCGSCPSAGSARPGSLPARRRAGAPCRPRCVRLRGRRPGSGAGWSAEHLPLDLGDVHLRDPERGVREDVARSPSLVSTSRPLVSASSRPTL